MTPKQRRQQQQQQPDKQTNRKVCLNTQNVRTAYVSGCRHFGQAKDHFVQTCIKCNGPDTDPAVKLIHDFRESLCLRLFSGDATPVGSVQQIIVYKNDALEAHLANFLRRLNELEFGGVQRPIDNVLSNFLYAEIIYTTIKYNRRCYEYYHRPETRIGPNYYLKPYGIYIEHNQIISHIMPNTPTVTPEYRVSPERQDLADIARLVQPDVHIRQETIDLVSQSSMPDYLGGKDIIFIDNTPPPVLGPSQKSHISLLTETSSIPGGLPPAPLHHRPIIHQHQPGDTPESISQGTTIAQSDEDIVLGAVNRLRKSTVVFRRPRRISITPSTPSISQNDELDLHITQSPDPAHSNIASHHDHRSLSGQDPEEISTFPQQVPVQLFNSPSRVDPVVDISDLTDPTLSPQSIQPPTQEPYPNDYHNLPLDFALPAFRPTNTGQWEQIGTYMFQTDLTGSEDILDELWNCHRKIDQQYHRIIHWLSESVVAINSYQMSTQTLDMHPADVAIVEELIKHPTIRKLFFSIKLNNGNLLWQQIAEERDITGDAEFVRSMIAIEANHQPIKLYKDILHIIANYIDDEHFVII